MPELTDQNSQMLAQKREEFSNKNNLVSDERGCRVKCLNEDLPHSECVESCSSECVNTCTSSDRTFGNCKNLCN